MSANGSRPEPGDPHWRPTVEEALAKYREIYGVDHPRPDDLRDMIATRDALPAGAKTPAWTPPPAKDPAVQGLLDQFGITDPRDSPPAPLPQTDEEWDEAWDKLADEVDAADMEDDLPVWDEADERLARLVAGRVQPPEARLSIRRREVPGAWLRGLKAAGITASSPRGKPLVIEFPCPYSHTAAGGEDWAVLRLQVDPKTAQARRYVEGSCPVCDSKDVEEWLWSCPKCRDDLPHALHSLNEPVDGVRADLTWLALGDRSPVAHVMFALGALALPRTATALLSELPDALVKVFRPERAVKPKSGGKPVVPKPMPPGVEIIEDGPEWTPETITAWLVAHGVEAKTGANQAWEMINGVDGCPPRKLMRPVQIERRAEWLRAGGTG